MLQSELSVLVGLHRTLTSKSIILLISENLNSSDEPFSGAGQTPLRGHPSPTRMDRMELDRIKNEVSLREETSSASICSSFCLEQLFVQQSRGAAEALQLQRCVSALQRHSAQQALPQTSCKLSGPAREKRGVKRDDLLFKAFYPLGSFVQSCLWVIPA